MTNETKQTAMELLFLGFKALSKASRDAGDEQTANLIDFLCEREPAAKEMEKEQMEDAWLDGNTTECDGEGFSANIDFEQWFNKTYGGNK